MAFLLLPILVACGPLIEFPGSGEPPRHFQISPNNVSLQNSAELNGENITIYMENVSSSGVLKTTSVLVKSGSNELKYFKDILWVDRTPILVERFLTDALSTGGSLRVVGAESIEIPSQYRLKIDLRDFYLETNQGGSSVSVNVGLIAMLVRNGPIEVLDVKEISIQQTIANDSVDTVISGYNDAMDKVAQSLLNWVHVTLDNKGS